MTRPCAKSRRTRPPACGPHPAPQVQVKLTCHLCSPVPLHQCIAHPHEALSEAARPAITHPRRRCRDPPRFLPQTSPVSAAVHRARLSYPRPLYCRPQPLLLCRTQCGASARGARRALSFRGDGGRGVLPSDLFSQYNIHIQNRCVVVFICACIVILYSMSNAL